MKQLEQDCRNAVRDLMATSEASSKLREALGDMQQAEFRATCSRNAIGSVKAWAITRCCPNP